MASDRARLKGGNRTRVTPTSGCERSQGMEYLKDAKPASEVVSAGALISRTVGRNEFQICSKLATHGTTPARTPLLEDLLALSCPAIGSTSAESSPSAQQQDRGRGATDRATCIIRHGVASFSHRPCGGRSLFAIWSSGRLGIVQLSGRAGAVIRDRGCNSPIVQSRGTRHGQAAQNPAQQAQTANRVLSGATNSPQPSPPSWPALLLITSPSPPASFLPKPLSGLFLPAEGQGKKKLSREGRSPRRKEAPSRIIRIFPSFSVSLLSFSSYLFTCLSSFSFHPHPLDCVARPALLQSCAEACVIPRPGFSFDRRAHILCVYACLNLGWALIVSLGIPWTQSLKNCSSVSLLFKQSRNHQSTVVFLPGPGPFYHFRIIFC
ncbi:hypothetical protein VTN00DRAFT_1179 [Thermoascus crustaceus]|uniref:uncharacterized protein n=1 Tax=Thermoascus crustaceus TaxID=5088 RepID=UPI0037430F5E